MGVATVDDDVTLAKVRRQIRDGAVDERRGHHVLRQGQAEEVAQAGAVGVVVGLDDGAVDVLRVMRILHDCGFDGVVIPDHAPQMSCAAPWHAGMAYALGFLSAGLKTLK